MAPQKSPAFQFYPKDFMAGTATMSLQEVGAYMRLLCYAWDTGSVPNDPKERARICVCSKAQERELWTKVGKKFFLQDDAFFNERLEEERKKQSEFRRRQSDKGKASAATRRQPEVNHGSTAVEARLDSGTNPESTLLSSSSSSLKKEQEQQRPHASRSDDRFDAWWASYPKKTGKGAALNAWKKLRPSEATVALMHDALKWQRTQPQWTKDGGAYVPNPATYLNQHRWEDEPFFATDAPVNGQSISAAIDAWGTDD